jgi:hypothetical protein
MAALSLALPLRISLQTLLTADVIKQAAIYCLVSLRVT